MASVFACAECHAVLTAPVSQVALPVHAHQRYRHMFLPALMESGTYAFDAERKKLVIAPADARGMVLIPELCDGRCFGPDGRDGPNLACEQCGYAVATRIDDCSMWQAVWFAAESVRVSTDGHPEPTVQWEALEYTAPSEPGDARWDAAIGAALAHLLAASGGSRVTFPAGIAADTFQHLVDALLPAGPPARTLGLAGPGLSSSADILLVPVHPQTGQAWFPDAVPLPAEVWTYLAFHNDRLMCPATGGLPEGVLRDDPLPPPLRLAIRPDPHVFLQTLARLPEIHEPWLQEIHDRVTSAPYAHPF